MKIDKQKLKALALAATESKWTTDDLNEVMSAESDQLNSGFIIADCQGPDRWRNAQYIAAACPATVLALLAEIERIGADRKACWEEFKVQGRQLDQIKDENEAFQGRLDLLSDENAALLDRVEYVEAKSESLRKDAERYRWTAIDGNWLARMFGKWRAHNGEYGEANPTAWHPSRGEAIDAAISHAKAMAKEASRDLG